MSLMAADRSLDFSMAEPLPCAYPETRAAAMQAPAGAVPPVAVGDTLTLKLFADTSFSLEIVAAPPAGIAGRSFIARDVNGSASATVKVTGDGARILVDDCANGRQYSVRCKDGKVSITERDNPQDAPDECGTCGGEIELPQPPAEETNTAPAVKSGRLLGASGGEFPLAEQKSVVDILVAFDHGAKAKCAALGFDGIEDFADYAVAKMNTVLSNTQLDGQFCYRLAGVAEIDDTWSAINDTLLQSLRNRSGKLAKINQLREKCGADTVTLLIDRTEGTTSGVGFEYSGDAGKTLEYFDGMNYACNVCDINTVHSRYTMSHETGHNMGCGHSNRQGDSSGPGRFGYSCGYHFEDKDGVKRYTIMGYDHTSPASGTYSPVPYFSTPDISPAEYGCALGVEGVNDNRGTLMLTHADIAGLREHVLPYDWDVRFLDDSGNDIPDGAYFYGGTYVTLTNSNPDAEIYYTTLDGTKPTVDSYHAAACTNIYVYLVNGPKTITACAVVDGVAQSFRSITLHDGLTWSGDGGGSGVWTSSDSSVKPWNGNCFVNGDGAVFPDLEGVSAATVTVKGTVSPGSVSFAAVDTAYTFDKGDDGAMVSVSGAKFQPAGNVVFNVPLALSASSFRVADGKTCTFNAPFGSIADPSSGAFAPENPIVVGNGSTLSVAPGAGNTQTFSSFNNSGDYYSSAKFNVGEGTVVFTQNGNRNGLFGSLQIAVAGGSLVFKGRDALAGSPNSTVTVENGGEIVFGGMENFMRRLVFNGGKVTVAGDLSYGRAFELNGAPAIAVNADSVFDTSAAKTENPYVYLRGGSPTFTFANNARLVNNIIYADGRSDFADASGGVTLSGTGTFVQNSFNGQALTYAGETTVGGGMTLELNAEHRNAGGYKIAGGARLTGTGSITGEGAVVLDGPGARICGSLKVANLRCAEGSALGDVWNPVSAVVTGSLSADAGAQVCVTNGYLAVGEGCDTSGFASAKLDIRSAGLVLSNSLSVAGLSVNNSTVTIANGATLNITGSVSLDCSKLKIVLENPAEEGTIQLLTAEGGFADISRLDISPKGYKAVLGDSTKQLCCERDPDYVEYQTRLPVVDVLVAFDKGAQTYMGERPLEEFAQLQIGRMNDILATNKLDTSYSYRLAGVCRVSGTYNNIDTAPSAVSEGDGAAVTLRAMRELYGADTVTLLVNTSGATLGNSSPLSSSTDVAGCHDDAFSVCSIAAVDTGSQHTMIHENAHNMGCGHARAQSTINSPFSYGRGCYFMDGKTKRHTIMAYDVDGTGVYAYPSPYFSTSSGEFGFALGDADNDNARVLRETCRYVAQWRDSVKPFSDEPVVTGENGRRIVSGCVFKDSIKVTVAPPVEGAVLYYTLDGSEPVIDNDTAWSSQSKVSLDIKADRTLKAACLKDNVMSPSRTVKFFKRSNIPSGGLWQTSLKYPWVDDGESIRSHNHTDSAPQAQKCTTPLKATVAGPVKLKFKHKSYFGGAMLAGNNYSHFDVLLDDSPVMTQTECTNSWTDAVVDIPGGMHEVTFVFSQRFAMNNPQDYKDGKPEADDAVWLKDIRFESARRRGGIMAIY